MPSCSASPASRRPGSRSGPRTAAAPPHVVDRRAGSGKQKRASAIAPLGVAAVDVAAGERGARSHRFSRPWRSSDTSPQVQPSHGTPTRSPDRQPAPLPRRASTAADDLMARYDRQLRLRQLAVDDVQIGAADAADAARRSAPDSTPARIGERSCPQRRPLPLEDHRAHAETPTRRAPCWPPGSARRSRTAWCAAQARVQRFEQPRSAALAQGARRAGNRPCARCSPPSASRRGR